ncbi:MAG: UDP-N-acetylmuramate:L-alanyl-gamma-D-glutamyl-meso-diaminopimelate ligase [Desulfomonilaceae bacterium]|nr:UDP-N-acetylmuramate:L-alanyl-gamma-D-glutamyl-meso-diaminopimelate ligase [Desulfomonilaceae bacterium]
MRHVLENSRLNDSSLPERPNHVHLMGICGTGMGSLAAMFHQVGCTVTGSDMGVYPPMSDFLKQLGIKVSEKYAPENLIPTPDLVVVGNVIRRTNPEAEALERSGIPYASMPEALNGYFIRDKSRIVVTGTHGKTTVSAMLAWILYKENLDPGFMIGGLVGGFEANYRLGQGRHFVLEGDEYDTAYFDKRPKFLHYIPDVAIVTSCEFDHADIYDSLDQIQDQFRAFVRLVPAGGRIIACAEHASVKEVISGFNGNTATYGLDPGMEWCACDIDVTPLGMKTTILRHGRQAAAGTIPLFGVHNISNAVAAIAAAERVGVEPQSAMDALESFQGVRRRQEVVGEAAGILVIDDFAHHPTEVRETCRGVRSRFPDSRITAVFEPRTNTSRRAFFQELYVSAFHDADLIVLREPRDPEKFPEGDRFSSRRLASDLNRLGKTAYAFEGTDDIVRFLTRELRSGDIVLIMSNGSFDNIALRLLDAFKERSS